MHFNELEKSYPMKMRKHLWDSNLMLHDTLLEILTIMCKSESINIVETQKESYDCKFKKKKQPFMNEPYIYECTLLLQ